MAEITGGGLSLLPFIGKGLRSLFLGGKELLPLVMIEKKIVKLPLTSVHLLTEEGAPRSPFFNSL